MATKAAARRAKRGPKPPRDLRVERVRTSRPAQAEEAERTELTPKERRRLLDEAGPMLAGGGIDLDRLGVRVLELAYCGWGPDDWRADPVAAAMAKAPGAAWADGAFREAAAWWRSLHGASRAHVIRLTRLCASADPVLLETGEDRWKPVERKVWRVPG